MLPDLGAGFGRARCEEAHEPRRLQRAVACVIDCALEAAELGRKVVDPLGGDPVLAHRVVLEANVLALFLVSREPKAAHADEAVTRERLDAIERALRPLPESERTIAAVRLACDVVAGGAAAQRKAPVAAACALSDAALVVHTDAETGLGEPQRSGAAGDTGADDSDVDAAVVPRLHALRCFFLEPVGVAQTAADATREPTSRGETYASAGGCTSRGARFHRPER